MSSLMYGAALLVAWVLGIPVYNLFFHPLRGIPGPFLAKISGWWLFALELTPTPHQELFKLHHKYGMRGQYSSDTQDGDAKPKYQGLS